MRSPEKRFVGVVVPLVLGISAGLSGGIASAATLALGTNVREGQSTSGLAPATVLFDFDAGRTRAVAAGTAPVFTPDGKRMVYVTRSGLSVVELATRRRRQLTAGKDFAPAVSPDGRRVLFNRVYERPPTPAPMTACEQQTDQSGMSFPPCRPPLHVDAAIDDDLLQVPIGGGAVTTPQIGGCLPAPAPGGSATLVYHRRGFGVGCDMLSGPVIAGDAPMSRPDCRGKQTMRAAPSFPRRAAWIGSRGGVLLVGSTSLVLATGSGSARCALITVPEDWVIRDAVPSPDGSMVAALVKTESRVELSVITVASGRVLRRQLPRDVRDSVDPGLMAWRPELVDRQH